MAQPDKPGVVPYEEILGPVRRGYCVVLVPCHVGGNPVLWMQAAPWHPEAVERHHRSVKARERYALGAIIGASQNAAAAGVEVLAL